MPPEEARVGRRVRVRDGSRRRPGLASPVGTIEKLWGDPGHPALDVLLDDGSLRLFWSHDLEEVAPARAPWWRRPVPKKEGTR